MEEEKVNKALLLSRICQEMRTPITDILELTAVAGTNAYEPEKVLECMNQINTFGRELLKTIDEIGNVAQAAGNQLVLRRDAFNLSSQLQYSINVLRNKAREKNHRIIIQKVELSHEKVIGDAQRLEAILEEITCYVLKYLPPEATLLIDIKEVASEKPGIAEYDICDIIMDGNLDESVLEATAPPFALENLADRDLNEVLGLSSAQRVIQCMGGYIRMEHTVPGRQELHIHFSLEIQEGVYLQTEELIGKDILIVDDELPICQCSSMVIRQLGMNCDYVMTGREAMDKLAEKDYFAVILDWHLAKEDGITLAGEIQKKNPDMPLLLMSEADWTSVEQEARQAGISNFLLKPLFPSELVACLQQYIDGMFKMWEKSSN